MNYSRIAAVTLLVAVPLAGAAAQGHPLAGKWAVEYAGGTRIENDEVTHITLHGTLTIEAKGDSLIGMLVVAPMPDMPARLPTRLAAKRTNGQVGFESRSQAHINENGQESVREVVAKWTISAHDDSLDGTVARTMSGMDGFPGSEPQPVKGTRIK